MSDYDYDFFVIGCGSGGVRAARIAANHGGSYLARNGDEGDAVHEGVRDAGDEVCGTRA